MDLLELFSNKFNYFFYKINNLVPHVLYIYNLPFISSTSGELLATVGSDPDFMLTVWEWKNEQTVLRSKAFSQDIYRVLWSADLEGVLTTAGTGHVRFWKMADTFTGLKLQAMID